MNSFRKVTIAVSLLLLGAFHDPAGAQEKITLLYQPNDGFSSAFVAADQGFFKKHGLEVEWQMTPLANNIATVLISGQAHIAGPTVLPILQANEAGLDLVVVAGGAVYPRPTDGLVIGTNSGIERAADLKGKTVGVPGLGTQLHVLMQRAVQEAGLNPTSVRYVEIGFLQASDALKARTIDAYTAVAPFTQRMAAAGTGRLLADWPAVPAGTTTIVYTTTRAWASQHRAAIASFRAGLLEGEEYAKTHGDDRIKATVSFLKLPAQIIAQMPAPIFSTRVSAQQIQFWIDLARQQKLIQNETTPAKILFE